jgi:hypothetical protein
VAVVDLGSGTSRKVALEVIRRMATGEAPEALCDFRTVAVDCDALVAGIPDLESAKEVHADFLSGKRGTPLPEENEEDEGSLQLQLGNLPDGMEHAEHVVSSLLGGKGGWTWQVKDDPLQFPLIEFFQTLRQHHKRLLLFIEHLPRFFGEEFDLYPLDGEAHLQSALAWRRVQVLIPCSVDVYRRSIERSAPLQRRIQVVCLPEVPDDLRL